MNFWDTEAMLQTLYRAGDDEAGSSAQGMSGKRQQRNSHEDAHLQIDGAQSALENYKQMRKEQLAKEVEKEAAAMNVVEAQLSALRTHFETLKALTERNKRIVSIVLQNTKLSADQQKGISKLIAEQKITQDEFTALEGLLNLPKDEPIISNNDKAEGE